MTNKFIFHIDVNSAFLSWTAVERLKQGANEDLRQFPTAIGGNQLTRHGVIVAASTVAKQFGIVAGEPILQAIEKCPTLKIFPPNFEVYKKYSDMLVNILKTYSNSIYQFSIDECFIEIISCNPIIIANEISNNIKKNLGFTVNIGISTNRILSKMASDFAKPDKVHTLLKNEIKDKLWHLPIRNLYMVGSSTEKKLINKGILTIGDLANTELSLLKKLLKSTGSMLYNYANGIETPSLISQQPTKGISNSTTLIEDSFDLEHLNIILYELCKKTLTRLQSKKMFCSTICVEVKSASFIKTSCQKKLCYHTDSLNQVYQISKELLKILIKKEPLRHIGVRLSGLEYEFIQLSFL